MSALVEPGDTYPDGDTSKLRRRQDDNNGVCFHKCQRIRLPHRTLTQLNEHFRSSFSELVPRIFDKLDALMAVCDIGRVGEDGVEED